jgi:hypothetical protein
MRFSVSKYNKKHEDNMMFMRLTNAVAAQVVAGILATVMMAGSVIAAESDNQVQAFPDKYMIRLGVYVIDDSNTQFGVSSDVAGLGTVIDYQRDFGGESGDTIPRIDAYYRFNEKHRINFTSFSIDRKGTRTLAIDPPIIIDGIDFSGGTINSDIKYTLYKLGYAYSFYRSSKIELSFSAGLNITTYDLKFNDGTNKVESADVTAPLPMFGLHMGYAITPKWSIEYVTEAFFIDIEDTFSGSLVSYEVSTEYKLLKHFAIGAGLARLNANVDVDHEGWKGSVSDSYRGYRVFGTFYF